MPDAEAGDWYVSLFGGAAFAPGDVADFVNYGVEYPDSYDFDDRAGYALGITVGTKVFDFMRIEGELSGTITRGEHYSTYYATNFESDVSALYLLGNVWLDLNTGSGITPYIGGGLGAAYTYVNLLDMWSGDWGYHGVGFAYQLGAGVQVDVADNVKLDLGYRYKAASNLSLDDTDEPGRDSLEDYDLSAHVLQAGLTFKF